MIFRAPVPLLVGTSWRIDCVSVEDDPLEDVVREDMPYVEVSLEVALHLCGRLGDEHRVNHISKLAQIAGIAPAGASEYRDIVVWHRRIDNRVIAHCSSVQILLDCKQEGETKG